MVRKPKIKKLEPTMVERTVTVVTPTTHGIRKFYENISKPSKTKRKLDKPTN